LFSYFSSTLMQFFIHCFIIFYRFFQLLQSFFLFQIQPPVSISLFYEKLHSFSLFDKPFIITWVAIMVILFPKFFYLFQPFFTHSDSSIFINASITASFLPFHSLPTTS